MVIRLQTAKGTDIPNSQQTEISRQERNWLANFLAKHRQAEFRTGFIPRYNCHGFTFASRRTRVWDTSYIQRILDDDDYSRVETNDVKPGDIVIYYGDDGDPTHSGIVVNNDPPLHVPIIVSKWGNGPEVIHKFFDVPSVYGTNHLYFRCLL
jgi:cell wall-associated NlpC family hydrolase